ncbi:MAG: DUF1572 family protein [Pirellulales bacterium]
MFDAETSIAAAFAAATSRELRDGLAKIEHCLAQLDERQVWWRPTPSQNSVANLMLHLRGNVRQWIVNGAAGAADDRNRPSEFAEVGPVPKAELALQLSGTIDQAVAVINAQTATSLLESRRIQGFDTTVLTAIVESVAHFRGHCQEIVSLTPTARRRLSF